MLQALLSLSVKQSEDVLVSVGQALVEALCGRPSQRSALAVFEATAADDTLSPDAMSPSHVKACQSVVDQIVRKQLSSIHAQVCIMCANMIDWLISIISLTHRNVLLLLCGC